MAAYYNEIKPEASAMLRQLIKDGLIADGEVDERSIAEVKSEDVRGFTQCHFFAGIGGWSVALRLAGWPDDRPVWTGSCPCQPFSPAGEGKAQSDERHLWPHWRRLITESKPATVFGEQVERAIAYGWLDDVFHDLEAEAYACAAVVLPACCVKAPHERQRIWFVANTESDEDRRLPEREFFGQSIDEDIEDISYATLRNDGGSTGGKIERQEYELGKSPCNGSIQEISDTSKLRLQRCIGWGDDTEGRKLKSEGQAMLQSASQQWDSDFPAPKICSVADGIPGRSPILHAFGNAIVPQVAAAFIYSTRGLIY